jgi:hypothetical protein
VESLVTALITGGSVLLFGYWFRYACLLILSAKTAQDYAADVATANQLSFLEVQAQLRTEGPVELDGLRASLDRDYALVTYLIQHAGGASESGLEDRMLQLNYRLTRLMYQAARRLSPAMARRALDEMSTVVCHFANGIGERAAAGIAA